MLLREIQDMYLQEEFVLTAIELMLMIVSRLEGGGRRRRCLFWCGWMAVHCDWATLQDMARKKEGEALMGCLQMNKWIYTK